MEYPLPEFYQMIYSFHSDFAMWILLLSVIFGFVLAFAVGANDSANSWGTPFGAGTVSLGVAFILGSIMETLGAMFLSAEVVKTVAGDGSIVNISLYHSDNVTEWNHYKNGEDYLVKEKTLMLGLLTSMLSSQIWQLVATYLAWPVSGTHAIISALFGFTLVENGWEGVNPGNANPLCGSGLFKVVYGLFLSPPLALFLAFFLYYAIYKFSVCNGKPLSLQNRLCYSFCVFSMFVAIGFTMATAYSIRQPIIVSSTSCMHPNKNLFGLLVGLACGLVIAVPFHFFLLPALLESKYDSRVSSRLFSKNKKTISQNDVSHKLIDGIKDAEKAIESLSGDRIEEADEIKNVFRPLQLIVACFAALNHGGNDVGNCIGPLVTIWFMYKNPIDYSLDETAYELLFWGGLGISLGLVMFGERVIMTMGTKITPMTPSLGFVVVLSSSLVVMLCSLLGIPTSTTQCQVMAVVGAGVARGAVDHGSCKEGLSTVDFRVFRNIGLSWICTIPFSIAISAGLYAALRTFVIGGFGEV